MWVKIKETTNFTAMTPDIEMMSLLQKGSTCIASYQPADNPNLPWVINHNQLDIRISDVMFRDCFEEITFIS